MSMCEKDNNADGWKWCWLPKMASVCQNCCNIDGWKWWHWMEMESWMKMMLILMAKNGVFGEKDGNVDGWKWYHLKEIIAMSLDENGGNVKEWNKKWCQWINLWQCHWMKMVEMSKNDIEVGVNGFCGNVRGWNWCHYMKMMAMSMDENDDNIDKWQWWQCSWMK